MLNSTQVKSAGQTKMYIIMIKRHIGLRVAKGRKRTHVEKRVVDLQADVDKMKLRRERKQKHDDNHKRKAFKLVVTLNRRH